MKKTNNRGFSLVELIVAIAILVFIMIAIASFMSTTTRSYVNTRDDAKVQQDGQEVFDAIADKLMQARSVRIGSQKMEYATLYDCNSVQAVESENYLLYTETSNTIASVALNGSSRFMHSYRALEKDAIGESDNLAYIAVLYDTKVSGTYGYAVDVYYFSNTNIYLYRTVYGARDSSLDSSSGTASDPTKAELDTFLTSCISAAASDVNSVHTDMAAYNSEHLLCDTLKYDDTTGIGATIYAIPDDNALYMTIEFAEGRAENQSEGMITIRNSYVLQTKQEKDDAAKSSSGS